MRFFEDMLSKGGFSDGDAMPAGISFYRTAYIKAMNRLLEWQKSRVRLVAYDRPGMHNSCLILKINEMFTRDWPEGKFCRGDLDEHDLNLAETNVPHDEGYTQAVSVAMHDLYIDEHVEVEISVNERSLMREIDDYLAKLPKEE